MKKPIISRNQSIIIMDDPYDNSNPITQENFNKWLNENYSARITYRNSNIFKTNLKEMERNSHPKVDSLRKELECYVIAWNTCLKGVVEKMDLILLLRNAHPAYTSNFASKLLEAGMLTKIEAKEFLIFVK